MILPWRRCSNVAYMGSR